jgi:hypothetical protein
MQLESVPGVSGDGIFKGWIDGTLINYWNNLNYLFTYAITGITFSGFGPGSTMTVTLASTPTGPWLSGAGHPVFFHNVGGTTQLNGQGISPTTVAANVATFTLDTTGFSAYTSGGSIDIMAGGFNTFLIQALYGGGGTNAPADEYVMVGRYMVAKA